ncbi:MAG: bifunctional phosphoglucose/phosphomannose isomerase, partial [Sulfolobales archaeon]
IIIGSEEIDLIFFELSNGILIKPFYDSILKNISSLAYLAGVLSISLAEKLGRDPLVLEKMKVARERTKSIFKEELKYYYS